MKPKYLCLILWLATTVAAAPVYLAAQAGPIKVGVLHSLSGTMAISETTLKDTVLMLIEDQNRKGGLLGRKLQPVVVDPASDWPLFAEKARELLEREKVSVVFGAGTSVSRKSVLPVFEKNNGLLFYPVQYVVEHDMEFVRSIASRVTVLHEGRVLAEGDMDTVQNDPRVIEVYLGP